MDARMMAGAFVAGLMLSMLPVGMQADAEARTRGDAERRWVDLTERLNRDGASASADARWAALRDRLEARAAQEPRIDRDQLGRALRNAAKFGKAHVAASLLAAGAPVDSVDSHGTSALYLAAKYGHADVAALLIEGGADLNTRNREGTSAIVIASVYGHDDVVRLLAGLDRRHDRQARSGH